jgi:hypothetical protein
LLGSFGVADHEEKVDDLAPMHVKRTGHNFWLLASDSGFEEELLLQTLISLLDIFVVLGISETSVDFLNLDGSVFPGKPAIILWEAERLLSEEGL